MRWPPTFSFRFTWSLRFFLSLASGKLPSIPYSFPKWWGPRGRDGIWSKRRKSSRESSRKSTGSSNKSGSGSGSSSSIEKLNQWSGAQAKNSGSLKHPETTFHDDKRVTCWLCGGKCWNQPAHVPLSWSNNTKHRLVSLFHLKVFHLEVFPGGLQLHLQAGEGLPTRGPVSQDQHLAWTTN